MSRVANQLTQVLDKTARLVELCAALQEENDTLRLENQSLEVAVETSKKLTIELEEHINKRKRREHDSTDYCHYRARRAAF